MGQVCQKELLITVIHFLNLTCVKGTSHLPDAMLDYILSQYLVG